MRELLARALPAVSARATVGVNQFDEMVPRCDLCLTVSGTATLHVAGWGVPMVVVYRGNPLLWHLIGRWIVKTRTYSLVNLLADARQPHRARVHPVVRLERAGGRLRDRHAAQPLEAGLAAGR